MRSEDFSTTPAAADLPSAIPQWGAPARLVVLVLGALVALAQPAASQSAAPQSRHARSDMGMAVREMGTDSRLKNLSAKDQMDLVEFVTGNMLFVVSHEVGHSLIDSMGLPVLGREEDAADSYATLSMLRANTDFSFQVLFQSARGWFLMDRRERKQGNMLAFYDEHGLDKQRAFQIVCLMVGGDAEKFKGLADWVKMPQSRQDSCLGDNSNASYSWDLVLKPHRRAADQPKTKIEVIYDEGKGNLDVYARSFRAIRFLETLSENLEEQYVWKKPITMKMQSCGSPDARWNIPDRTIYVCYEMAEEFVRLYRGYTEVSRTSTMPSNDLIARNVRRLRVGMGMSQDGLASDAKMDQAWLTRMESGKENATVLQLEQLARALNVETAAFFTSPATADKPSPAIRQDRRRARK